MDTKQCSKCRVVLPRSAFCADARNRSGLQAQCKSCYALRARQFYSDNAARLLAERRAYRRTHRAKIRATNLKSLYGLSVAEYEALFKTQNGRCAICQNIPKEGTPLQVDHKHSLRERKTVRQRGHPSEVRGLLCLRCNSLLGHALDNPAILYHAIDYLRWHST